MENKFYIFGSENSRDYDVLVSVEEIPTIEVAHSMCKKFNEEISKLLPGKEINSNLAVFGDGTITDVFKGTVDELINVLYYTYDNHKQFYPNPIDKPIERDIDAKILRVARFIITFYSRTELRPEVKAALRGNLVDKLNVLKKIDFVSMREFPSKKENYEDIYKVIAFQFGQVFSLIDGYEKDSYTKNGVIKNYPDLSNMLNRNVMKFDDFSILNKYKNRFIDIVEDSIKRGISLYE